jgi:hypothetical protein
MQVEEVFDSVIKLKFQELKASEDPKLVAHRAAMDKWFTYLESTWIRGKGGKGKKSPLFPIPTWNQNRAARFKWPRTNNSSEGM